jgi:hypothetical protein
MKLFSSLTKVVTWLRAGGSGRTAWHGGIPLLALAGRQLTDDDVTLIAGELAFSPQPGSDGEIKKAVRVITRMTAGDPDVAKVRSRLAAAGWQPAPSLD